MIEIFTNLPLGFVNEDRAFWSQSNGPDAPVWAVDAQIWSHVIPLAVGLIWVYQLVPFGTTSPHDELPPFPLGVFFYNWWW